MNNIEPSEVLERTAFFERVMMVVETAAMVAFAISSLVIIPDLIAAANIHGTASLWLLALVPLAHVAADVFTGFMHFFADNFCSDDTPIVGPAFVRRFREHHVDQTAICRLSFRELNGGLVLVATPIFLPIAIYNDESASLFSMGLTLFAWIFLLFGTSTNQIHRWSHDPAAPKIARWLADCHLVLNREHHAHHHVPPHDSHFCITHGWLNPLLDRLGFWHLAAKGLARLGVPQFPQSVMGEKRPAIITSTQQRTRAESTAKVRDSREHVGTKDLGAYSSGSQTS